MQLNGQLPRRDFQTFSTGLSSRNFGGSGIKDVGRHDRFGDLCHPAPGGAINDVPLQYVLSRSVTANLPRYDGLDVAGTPASLSPKVGADPSISASTCNSQSNLLLCEGQRRG